MYRKVTEVVGVCHDGELVCWDCMDEKERRVAEDAPDAQEICDADGYLSVVFLGDVYDDDVCGRCLCKLL